MLPRDTAIGWAIRLTLAVTATALLTWMVVVGWHAWVITPNPEDYRHWVNPTGGKSGSKAEYLFGPVLLGLFGWCFAVKWSLSREAAFDPVQGLRDGRKISFLLLWLCVVLGGTYLQSSSALNALQRNAQNTAPKVNARPPTPP